MTTLVPTTPTGGTSGEGNFWMGGDGNEASGSAYYINARRVRHDHVHLLQRPAGLRQHPDHLRAEQRGQQDAEVQLGATPRLCLSCPAQPGGTRGRRRFLRRIRLRLDMAARWAPTTPSGSLFSRVPVLVPAATVSNSNTTSAAATMENTFGIIDMTNALNAYQPLGSVALYGKPYQLPHRRTRKLSTPRCSSSSPATTRSKSATWASSASNSKAPTPTTTLPGKRCLRA